MALGRLEDNLPELTIFIPGSELGLAKVSVHIMEGIVLSRLLSCILTRTEVINIFTIVKPESMSPIPCPNRPQILTLRSDQV